VRKLPAAYAPYGWAISTVEAARIAGIPPEQVLRFDGNVPPGPPPSATPETVAAALAEHGFAFLFAPAFHPALAVLAPLRRELGVRTVFNLLGPLVNPARPTHQLIGAATDDVARRLARAAGQLDLGRGEVLVGRDQLRDTLPRHTEHLRDLGHTHEVVRHAARLRNLLTPVKSYYCCRTSITPAARRTRAGCCPGLGTRVRIRTTLGRSRRA